MKKKWTMALVLKKNSESTKLTKLAQNSDQTIDPRQIEPVDM
jgi:hypothetical protein